MNDIIPFSFEGHNVRVAPHDGTAHWVLADVCEVLGIRNSSDAASRLDADEKADVGITDTSSTGVTQRRTVTAINESGLWSLVLTSRKPEAKRFKKWLTSEVIPTIRKTGGYAIAGTSLSADTRKVLGGMIKSISRAQIREELAEMESRITNLVATHQAGTAAVTDKTAKEWCEEYGLTQKGRNGPRRKIGNALSALAKQQGIICHRCARTGTWLYPAELARPYMDGIGRHIIKLHNNAVLNGQPDLGLGNKRQRA